MKFRIGDKTYIATYKGIVGGCQTYDVWDVRDGEWTKLQRVPAKTVRDLRHRLEKEARC